MAMTSKHLDKQSDVTARVCGCQGATWHCRELCATGRAACCRDIQDPNTRSPRPFSLPRASPRPGPTLSNPLWTRHVCFCQSQHHRSDNSKHKVASSHQQGANSRPPNRPPAQAVHAGRAPCLRIRGTHAHICSRETPVRRGSGTIACGRSTATTLTHAAASRQSQAPRAQANGTEP